MTKKAKAEALEELHAALASALADRIRDGTASAADLGVARQFLKDNGVDAIPRKGQPLGDLLEALPFPSEANTAEEEDTHTLN